MGTYEQREHDQDSGILALVRIQYVRSPDSHCASFFERFFSTNRLRETCLRASWWRSRGSRDVVGGACVALGRSHKCGWKTYTLPSVAGMDGLHGCTHVTGSSRVLHELPPHRQARRIWCGSCEFSTVNRHFQGTSRGCSLSPSRLVHPSHPSADMRRKWATKPQRACPKFE